MNIFFIILILFPAISIIIGAVGNILFRNLYIAPAFVFISFMIATFLLFNETFLIWVFVYTIAAILSGLFVHVIIKSRH
ncbi:YbeF family protein [Rossellomorea aquimaris]|uniref:DUF2651 family protein n=1 Tax=Rossellomorea aquimaris TaxID=189382 RepID=UPI001CD4932B|nr:DUF2651 family protein [Rossellomorea aquimaris]MCA1054048.1 YbeF family protein [Rossellomorea aquimaris]